MQSLDSPNPACPNCQSKDVFEIVHDLAAAQEIASFAGIRGKLLSGIWIFLLGN